MLPTLSNRFRFKLASGQTLRFRNAVTRSLIACQELQPSRTRLNCTSASNPSFNFRSTFKVTLPPNPTWNVGDGLTGSDHTWKDEIIASKKKSWDFTNLENLSIRDSYRTLVSAIVPRPIALVSTLSKDGNVPNLATFSYFSMVGTMTALRGRNKPKDTRNNILATREFTISIISEGFAEAANSTSVESPADTDEWLISGLAKENSDIVKPPFVRESAVAMECELYSFQDIGVPGSVEPTVTVVLGLIKKLHVREAVLCEDGITVDPAKLRPIARLGGTTYGRLLEGFDLPRPSWKAIREEYPKLSRP